MNSNHILRLLNPCIKNGRSLYFLQCLRKLSCKRRHMIMNKVFHSHQLNKKSGAWQKLTELTGFTHMKHVLITDTKTGVSGVTSNAQLFDDHIVIAMLATKEKGKCRKTFWSTDFISPSMISMVLICRLPIMPLAQHRNLRSLRCQSGRSARRTVIMSKES